MLKLQLAPSDYTFMTTLAGLHPGKEDSTITGANGQMA